MFLGEDGRGADAAIWRRADVGPYEGGFRRVPPVLAVEVTGRYERARQLRAKARWYLDAAVPAVWIVLPQKREVLVVPAAGERRHRCRERPPRNPRPPQHAPVVHQL